MLYDPDRVGGLHATHGLTGVRRDAPDRKATSRVPTAATTSPCAVGGQRYQDFRAATYPAFFSSPYMPVSTPISYNSTNPFNRGLCGRRTSYDLVTRRTALLPFGLVVSRIIYPQRAQVLRRHRRRRRSRTNSATLSRPKRTSSTGGPVRIKEQQADCFAGVYLPWVAQDRSTRFAMNTTDGLTTCSPAQSRRGILLTNPETLPMPTGPRRPRRRIPGRVRWRRRHLRRHRQERDRPPTRGSPSSATDLRPQQLRTRRKCPSPCPVAPSTETLAQIFHP